MRDITSGKKYRGAKQLIETSQNTIHSKAFRRKLCKAGLKSLRKNKRPSLSLKDRTFRLRFARKYESWTVEDLKSVVWSDETRTD